MSNNNIDHIKTSNEKTFKQSKQEADLISYDAPPLDFSFKNIKNLEQLKVTQPRQGQKKNQHHQQSKPFSQKQQKEEQINGEQSSELKGQKKKNQMMRLLPQSNIGSVVSTMVNNTAMKNISLKAKEELEKKKKKAIRVKLVCSSLNLGYNKIRQLLGLNVVMGCVMDNFSHLQWIDISHNYLTSLDYDFTHFPYLKTLYLHCNYLHDLSDLEKLNTLQILKNLTVHGNQFTSVPNFRILSISILPNLKKLDNVLISKKQRDNSIFIRSQIKKYPQPKKPEKPPVEKKEQDQEDKQ